MFKLNGSSARMLPKITEFDFGESSRTIPSQMGPVAAIGSPWGAIAMGINIIQESSNAGRALEKNKTLTMKKVGCVRERYLSDNIKHKNGLR